MSLATGPQDLQWPDGRKATTRRGILMGLPTTWFLLCMVHLFWIDEATRGMEKGLDGRAAVCGDDLLAHWPQKSINRYHKLLSLCGAKISEGKHFVFNRRGIFTEKPFTLRRGKPIYRDPTPAEFEMNISMPKIGRLSGLPAFMPCFPLRGLNRPSGDVWPNGRNGDKPIWNALGLVFESLVRDNP
jgi:hypothetical protein